MESTKPKVLLTGASGYLGGSVLSSLLASVQNVQVSALVRSSEQADWLNSNNVRPVLFKGFNDLNTITRAASEHDAVINCASGFEADVAVALLRGLAESKIRTGNDVFMIHTSGTSCISDIPVSGKLIETRTFDDASDNIHEYLKQRQSVQTYAQRTADLAVAQKAAELGVKTYTIMAPPVFGTGTGHFNRRSTQIPLLINKALDARQALYVGDGMGNKDYVHVSDLADFYELLFRNVLADRNVVNFGERGIFFAGTGRFRWRELAESIARIGYELGALNSDTPRSISLQEALSMGFAPNEQHVELVFASNSKAIPSVAKSLGWKPTKTEVDWEEFVKEDFRAVLERRGKK